ncbi:MAG: bacteriohemerythrin [Proteobacteria bacterium]|nr:bacteriohemerythrin [Pseudomonadota bacterium]
MEWKSTYSVGVSETDQQHHEIFESMLRLEESLEKKASRDVLVRHIGEIRQLLYQHFLDEENLLQRLGYPDLPLHKEQHERLVSALADFERAVLSSRDPQCLVTFFEDWFVRHVLDEDKSFSSFVSAAEDKQLAAKG